MYVDCISIYSIHSGYINIYRETILVYIVYIHIDYISIYRLISIYSIYMHCISHGTLK